MRIVHLSDLHLTRGMILDDAAALAAVIRKHPHVVRVLAGHVHRDASAPFARTLMATAPSTFRPSALRLHDAEPRATSPSPPASCCTCSTGPVASRTRWRSATPPPSARSDA